MKYIYAILILYFICSSAILSASPIEFVSQNDPLANKTRRLSNQPGNLQISLLTDKISYSVGDEIHFVADFFNRGGFPFRIMVDHTFIGSNIECADIQGNKCASGSGYNAWSPKAGVYTGRTYLLKPNEKMNIKMDALVYNNYQLIFSNLFDRKGSDGYQEFKKRINLPSNFPDKYISAGRIISLPNPNKYRFTCIYETTEADRKWQFAGAQTPQEASVELLWIGKTISNTIEISIK